MITTPRAPRPRSSAGSCSALLAPGGALAVTALVCTLVLMLCGNIPASAAGRRTHLRRSPEESVLVDTAGDLTVNGSFRGLGVEMDQDLLWTEGMRSSGSEGMQDYQNVIAPRLKDMGVSFTRSLIDLSWLFPADPARRSATSRYQPGDPATYATSDTNAAGQAIYTPDSIGMRALEDVLATEQKDGIESIFTVQWMPGWMNPSNAQGGPTSSSEARVPNAANLDEYGAEIAWFVTYLHRIGYTNVVAVDAPNELQHANWAVYQDGPSKCPSVPDYVRPGTPTQYDAYVQLVRRLQEYDTSVQLFGPDLTTCYISEAASYAPYAGLVSFFDYHDYNGEVTEQQWLHSVMPQVIASHKQLWISEIGGLQGTPTDPELTQGDLVSAIVPKTIDALDDGVAAISTWDAGEMNYGNGWAGQRKWGLWGYPDAVDGHRYALRDSYYAWMDMARGLRDEGLVYPNTCSQGCGALRIAVAGNRSGKMTVLMYNTSDAEIPVRIGLSSLTGSDVFTKYVAHSDPGLISGSDTQGPQGTAVATRGVITNEVPPNGLVVLVN